MTYGGYPQQPGDPYGGDPYGQQGQGYPPGYPAPGYPAPGYPAPGYPGQAYPAPGYPQQVPYDPNNPYAQPVDPSVVGHGGYMPSYGAQPGYALPPGYSDGGGAYDPSQPYDPLAGSAGPGTMTPEIGSTGMPGGSMIDPLKDSSYGLGIVSLILSAVSASSCFCLATFPHWSFGIASQVFLALLALVIGLMQFKDANRIMGGFCVLVALAALGWGAVFGFLTFKNPPVPPKTSTTQPATGG